VNKGDQRVVDVVGDWVGAGRALLVTPTDLRRTAAWLLATTARSSPRLTTGVTPQHLPGHTRTDTQITGTIKQCRADDGE
jgi:integrase